MLFSGLYFEFFLVFSTHIFQGLTLQGRLQIDLVAALGIQEGGGENASRAPRLTWAIRAVNQTSRI